MNRHWLLKAIVVLIISSAIECKSVSKFAIDKGATIKIDSGLLGIWKEVEDTDKGNFFLVQSPYDIFHEYEQWYNLDSAEKSKIIDKRRWKDSAAIKSIFQKNDAQYYEDYFKFIAEDNSYYHLTYFDGHGRNPYISQDGYFSKINNQLFLNIGNAYGILEGYLFLKLINVNKDYDTVTATIVIDTTLQYLANSKEVRKRVKKNINNPAFYSDTLHFYKVNNYHSSSKEAVLKAN